MAHLIDKDALIAEIERRIKAIPRGEADKRLKAVHAAIYGNEAFVLMCLLSFINKLEVKEVDLEHLEQEVKDFCYKFDDRKDKWYDMTPHDKNIMISPTWSNFAMQLAKHFFVLGLKAQKEEKV